MEISPKELWTKKNIQIIDIRSPEKYLEGHIPGALSINAYDLLFHTEKYLKKEETYYLYCDSGIRSRMLTEKLNRKGYSTVNITGGYHNYLLIK